MDAYAIFIEVYSCCISLGMKTKSLFIKLYLESIIFVHKVSGSYFLFLNFNSRILFDFFLMISLLCCLLWIFKGFTDNNFSYCYLLFCCILYQYNNNTLHFNRKQEQIYCIKHKISHYACLQQNILCIPSLR